MAQHTIVVARRLRLFVQAACGAAALVCLAGVQEAGADLTPGLVRNGFTSVSGESVRGKHIVTGWTAGQPFSTHADAGPGVSSVDLYAMYWARIQYADVPPAPDVTEPVPLLGGQTGLYESVGFAVMLIGTKPPYPQYNFHSWVLVATNDVPLPLGAVNQVEDGSQWNMSLPLQTDAMVRVSLICSNLFGLSAGTTVLDIDQVPEPAVLVLGVMGAYAALRRRTPTGQPR